MVFARVEASPQGSGFHGNYACAQMRCHSISCGICMLVVAGGFAANPMGSDQEEPLDRAFTRVCARATSLLDPASDSQLLGPLLDTHKLRTPLQVVMSDLTHFCSRAPDDLMSIPMREAISRPLALADIAARTAAPLIAAETATGLVAAPSNQRRSAQLICTAFGTPKDLLPPCQGDLPVANPQGAIFALDFLLNQPRLLFEPALHDRPSSAESLDFLAILTREMSLSPATAQRLAPFAERARRAIDMSDQGVMLAVARTLAHIDSGISATCDWAACVAEPLSPDIAPAVSGAVLAGERVEGIGWVIVGSLENNTYDMRQIAAVFDPGGDDSYTWDQPYVGNQAVLDRAGNDRYVGGATQGPAAGLFGVSLIDDLSGNDHYSGASFACGAGLFGVGILMDRAGNDRYDTGAWSLGTGVFGAGFLFDEAGDDSYRSAVYSQGVGGPLGVGVLVDHAGNDLFRADGVIPSVYGQATVSFAMSQGVGFGVRPLCAGGVGILTDRAGDDRYEGGEFSQGGGYYYGFGMLIDHLGSDLYRGDHFAQGFTAHQAAGVLIDVAGDDCYWSTTSAAQGAAWDTATSLLVDGAGNDTYRGGPLSQGSAAQQGIAALCDLDGSDHYGATHTLVQGESCGNEYHFTHAGARSFSVLIDSGDGIDFFSTNRTLGGVTVTGPTVTTDLPAGASLFGIAIDMPPAKSAPPAR